MVGTALLNGIKGDNYIDLFPEIICPLHTDSPILAIHCWKTCNFLKAQKCLGFLYPTVIKS